MTNILVKIISLFKRLLPPFGIIAVSIFIFLFLFKSKPPAQQKIVEEKIWFIKSQTAQLSDHQPIIQLVGKINSAENIEISSTIEADVSKRWVSVGDQVSKGQKLLNLNPSRLNMILAQRQAEKNEISALIKEELKRLETDTALLGKEKSLLTIANNAVTRAQTLEKSAMASSSQLDDAKRTAINQQIAITQRQANIDDHPIRLLQLNAKLKTATSRLAIANDDLSHTKIISPINGIVTKIDLNQSEHVRKGTSLVTLYNHRKLEIKAFVPDKYIAPITRAMNANLPLNGTATIYEQNSPITLLRLGGDIQKNAAGSYLYFSLDTQSVKLVPGQTLTLQLNMPKIKNTFSIPSDALYGVAHVYTVEQERLKRVNVNWLGETFSNDSQRDIRFLIRSDELHDGDTLLISKFANAMDGLKVTTQPDTKNNPNSSTDTLHQ